ncbi:MAG: hypothetical protein AAF985_17015 [Bacteroidota bacterium]
MKLSVFLLLLSICFFNLQCTPTEQDHSNQQVQAIPMNYTADKNNFKDYWYQGKAEITSFELEQARYGEVHRGHAVMVFVTEPFSKSKLVKLDNPAAAGQDAASVLKLNFTRKFNTGVYPYSTMQSIFTPVELKDNPHSLKVTTSSQEWCGHTFQQLSLKKDHYENLLYSYFESEGDKKGRLDKTLLEDEIWNRIRVAPKSLPTGNIQLIPNTLAARFKHFPLRNEAATAQLKDHPEQKDWMEYQIDYKNIDRQVKIHFTKAFPHEILGWEEAYRSGWGANAGKLVTKARKNKQLMLDYWSKNSLSDATYRQALGLE